LAGIAGYSSLIAIPPVNKNLNYSSANSPLNDKILDVNKKEKSNLSLSNKDLQILQYKKYKKYSLKNLK